MSTIKLGDKAPNFVAETTFGSMDFYQWLGDSWGILFSHPADFTPVCTTELGYTAKLMPEFAKRDVKVIALSVDTLSSHQGWIEDINSTQQTEVNFPLIADENRAISQLYGMIHEKADDSVTVRSVFIIGPDKKVKLTLTYPASTGRNFDELLRVIDSLQLTIYQKLATPANWKPGEKCVILPTVDNQEAVTLFTDGFEEIKPYLRFASHF